MALQIRRGPTADRVLKTFAEGEIIYDTDLQQVFIGDGQTMGGKSVSTYTDIEAVAAAGTALENGTHSNIAFTYDSQTNTINANVSLDGGLLNVVEDTTPQLGGNLDLNSHTINGTGAINITGSVTATSFSGPLTGNVTGSVSGNAGTVTNGIYTSHNFYIGTEQISITRASNAQTLAGVSIDGNAGTATKLAATKNINGVAFDGSADITVYDSTKLPTAGGTVSGNLTVTGTLTVNGTTTTINSTTLAVTDKNITLAKDATNGVTADGAGITVGGVNATLLYDGADDKFVFNKRLDATSFYGPLTGNVSGNVTGNINGVVTGTAGSALTGNVTGNITGNVISSNNGTSVILDTSTATATLTGNVSGNITGTVNATGTNRVLLGDGTATTPSLAFDSDGGKDTGFYWGGDGYINISNNAVNTGSFGPEGVLVVNTSVRAPTVYANSISVSTGGDGYVHFPTIVSFDNDVNFTANAAFLNNQAVFVQGLKVQTLLGSVKVDVSQTNAKFNVPVRFGSYTTTERNALTPANGDVIYCTDSGPGSTGQFLGYANGAWVSLS